MSPQDRPVSTDDRLEKIAELLGKLTGPMACVLKELKASNRSRWIVMLSMAAIVMVTATMMWAVMRQMSDLMDRMETTQGALIGQMVQVQQLVEFADKTAKTPDQKNRVENMKKLYGQTPVDLIRAAAQFAPEAVLEVARGLEVKDGGSTGKE